MQSGEIQTYVGWYITVRFLAAGDMAVPDLTFILQQHRNNIRLRLNILIRFSNSRHNDGRSGFCAATTAVV